MRLIVLKIFAKISVWGAALMSLYTGIWAVFNSLIDVTVLCTVFAIITVILDRVVRESCDGEDDETEMFNES